MHRVRYNNFTAYTHCASANRPAFVRSCWWVHTRFLFFINDAHKRNTNEHPLVEKLQPVTTEGVSERVRVDMMVRLRWRKSVIALGWEKESD